RGRDRARLTTKRAEPRRHARRLGACRRRRPRAEFVGRIASVDSPLGMGDRFTSPNGRPLIVSTDDLRIHPLVAAYYGVIETMIGCMAARLSKLISARDSSPSKPRNRSTTDSDVSSTNWASPADPSLHRMNAKSRSFGVRPGAGKTISPGK